MLFKLALKNMQKSVKDYAIYFFTLVFAVAMFYTFNSLDAQTSMSALNESSMTTIKQVVTIINYLSVFVAIILGFLIVYANNFLIKRRKKEFGLYLTLGMSKRKVALILVLETLIIGIISLAVGLLIGFGLSQLFSLLTIKMFDADMSKYKFIFSINALKQTIIDFGVIYLLAIIFDTISITRFKLIDLIMAAHKNEQIKIKNKYLIGLTFILAICLIGYGYYLLFQNVMFSSDNTNKIIIMFASGAIGTLLLFYSLSSILLGLFKRIGSFYYKGLNMFVLKQVNNKINTTVISNTIISLMLMFTIAILSTAVSLTNSVNKGINENNLIDYTVLEFANQNIDENGQISTEPYNINEIINSEPFKKLSNEYLKFNIYDNQEITNGSLLKAEDITELAKKYGADTESLKNGSIPIMRSSDYISFMKLTNQENNIVNIDDTNYLLLANVDFTYDRYNKFYSEGNTLDFANYHLVPASSSVYRTAIENSSVNSNSGILVLSDKIIDNNLINIPFSTNSNGFYSREEYLLGNFINTDDINATNKAFNDMFENAHYGCMYMTKEDMKNDSIGVKVMMTFIGLYLGITFAISSATVLAIGQLSEAQDNKERYKVLKDLGADNKDINNCLLKQIAIAFGFPLIVGVIHSLVGLKEINKILDMFGHIDISKNIVLISLFIIILYGGYFFVTYLNSKRLIKK